MDDDELVQALDDAEQTEIDRIDPVPDILALKCGIEVSVLPMRTRQLFKLLRIITHGAGNTLMSSGLDLNFNDDPSDFLRKLITIVLFSIPDAEQETIDFLQSIVEPVGLHDKAPREMSEKERQHNLGLWQELNTELWNPDPLDTLDLVENIIRRESRDLQALGKRIRQFLELAQRTGQLKDGANGRGGDRTPASSETSRGRSTSSAASTGGQTRRSSASRSGGSGRSSRQSPSGSGKRSAAAAR